MKKIRNMMMTAACMMMMILGAAGQVNAISSTDNCVTFPEGYEDTFEYVELYNGEDQYLKLEVVGLVNVNGVKCVMQGNNRLTAVSFESPTKIRFFGNWGFGTDGFVDGDVNVKVYYDFNKDGDWADDGEYIGTMTHHISKRSKRAEALEVAKAAIAEYKTNNYAADMSAIAAYLYKNYPHSKYACGWGAGILETWSIYKYGVHGQFDNPDPVNNPSHVAFYPEENEYSPTLYWEAQGYKGSAPIESEIAYYERRVELFR